MRQEIAIMKVILSFRNFFLAFIVGIGFSLSAMAQYETPSITVQSMLDVVLDILRAPDFDIESDKAQIDMAVSGAFDPNTIAQSALGASYRDFSREQRAEFEDIFFSILKDTYLERLDSYTDETFEVLGESIEPPRATVETMVNTTNSQIKVNYSLRQRDNGWFIYDIIVEDVSLLSSYRSTYRSIIRRDGIEALFEELRTQAAGLE
jgi:phospholipid transport system substrate-binding protein